jgi:hypothetical protein
MNQNHVLNGRRGYNYESWRWVVVSCDLHEEGENIQSWKIFLVGQKDRQRRTGHLEKRSLKWYRREKGSADVVGCNKETAVEREVVSFCASPCRQWKREKKGHGPKKKPRNTC